MAGLRLCLSAIVMGISLYDSRVFWMPLLFWVTDLPFSLLTFYLGDAVAYKLPMVSMADPVYFAIVTALGSGWYYLLGVLARYWIARDRGDEIVAKSVSEPTNVRS